MEGGDTPTFRTRRKKKVGEFNLLIPLEKKTKGGGMLTGEA